MVATKLPDLEVTMCDFGKVMIAYYAFTFILKIKKQRKQDYYDVES
jgi:hypothetical protein